MGAARHCNGAQNPPGCYCRVSLAPHSLQGAFWEGTAVPTGLGWGCSAGPTFPPQHFALFLKYIIQVAIPDIPAWVAEEMAKLEYQRREAFKVGDAGVGPSLGPSTELGHPHPWGGWASQGVPKVSPGLTCSPLTEARAAGAAPLPAAAAAQAGGGGEAAARRVPGPQGT